MISQETFDRVEMEHGCGYWNMCWEHACPCAITTENKGLTEKIYNDFCEENRKLAEETDIIDFDDFRDNTEEELDINAIYWDDECEDEFYSEDEESLN
jgi:hypothetical protein